MSTSAEKKMIKLVSSDGDSFEVEEAVALESQTLKHIIEDGCADNGIPVPNVTSKILAKVIEYCKMHVDAAAKSIEAENLSGVDRFCLFLAGNPITNEEQLQAWDQAFVNGVDQETLFDLILAASYLNIKTLLDLTCQKVADMLKVKTPEEIKATFIIKNDFTPEEEEEVRRANPWAFE